MSCLYLYCQNTACGVYLGSLGGSTCTICGWHARHDADEEKVECGACPGCTGACRHQEENP